MVDVSNISNISSTEKTVHSDGNQVKSAMIDYILKEYLYFSPGLDLV